MEGREIAINIAEAQRNFEAATSQHLSKVDVPWDMYYKLRAYLSNQGFGEVRTDGFYFLDILINPVEPIDGG